MIIAGKKPISALKLFHFTNHTQTGRYCNINSQHNSLIKTLSFKINEPIYNLAAGLYKVVINEIIYVIDIYFNLRDADHLIIKDENNINLTIASNYYPIIAYKLLSVENIISPYNLIGTVNDNIDAIMITGNTIFNGIPSLNNPTSIDRINSITINTNNDLNNDSLKIYLNHPLGCLPNGVKDTIIINADQLIAHYIINTSKEILSGGLNWEYKESLSNSEYYVFFAKYNNIKLNNSNNSIRCSHFETTTCSTLINKSTKKNCIASSYDPYDNGIWIKIAASVLNIHGDKDFGKEMQKWILNKAISQNPIYIEYEIANPIYNTIFIDEYYVKTWNSNTIISTNIDNGFSVFYKAMINN